MIEREEIKTGRMRGKRDLICEDLKRRSGRNGGEMDGRPADEEPSRG